MKNIFPRKVLSLLLSVITVISTAACLSSCGNTKKLVILSLGDYFDKMVFDKFEKETGCAVKLEELSTSEEIYAKFSAGSNNYDLICISDYMIERLINEKLISELDLTKIPNYKNIDQTYLDKSKSFDPQNKYTVPHFWGTTGLLYNTKKVNVEDIKSWNVLWNKKYSGRIIMMNSIRDAFIPALELLGYPLNTTDKSQLDEAKKLLIDQRPLVQSYLVDEARDEVVAGNADIAMAYSGEAYLGYEYNPDLAYIVPDEGSNIWIDSLCITAKCEDTENAHKFIDFLCRKDIAAQNFDYIYYSTPNKAVIDSLDEDVKSDKAIFPDKSTIDNCDVFHSLGSDIDSYYSSLWKEIKAE